MTNTPAFQSSLQKNADVVDDTGIVDPLAAGKISSPQSFASLFDSGSVLGLAERDALTSSASAVGRDDTAGVTTAETAGDQSAMDLGDSGAETVALSGPAVDQDAAGGDNDKFLLSSSSASSLMNASDSTFNNNTETNPLSFSNSGLASNETETTTFVGPIDQNVGSSQSHSADLSALSSKTVASSSSQVDPTGQNATVGDKAVPLFTSSQLTPAVTVNATNPADVTFTVGGLQAGDHGTVTFTDAKGVQDVVNVGSNGNYTTNLSNLATGTIDYTLSVTDPAGHVTTVDPTTSLGTVAGFALDANGWPIITPQSNSHIIYVSSSTGNDNNNGLTPQTAVATIAKGETLLRNGYPDQLLLKAGDTFVNQSFGDLTVSGQSATAPMVIGTYGTGAAPIVETTPSSNWGVGIGSLPGQGGNFLVVEGIDFYDYTRDPSNPAYAGPNTTDTGTNFLNPNTTVTLIGDKFSFYATDIVFNSGSSAATSSTVTLYRNVVTDAWSATSHSQGLYVSGVGNLVVEQNVFDHNGWNASIPGAEETIFNRNVYLQSNNGPVTFTGNISANSSSEGVQVRSGGTITGNLFLANSAGFSIGENPGTSSTPLSTLTSTVATGNVVLNSTDIHSSSGLQARSDGIVVNNASGPGVQVTNNIVADPTGSLVNQSGISLNNNVTGINATNNIIYDVANPVVDSGTGNTTSPNAINQTGYVNPNVSIGSYNASLGGSASLAAFMAAADNQSMTNWNPAYTAAAADSYIQAGFSTSGTSTDPPTGPTTPPASPTISSIVESPSSGDLNAGKTVTLTLKLSEVVTVAGGTPTITLNDGGTATYTSGSGTSALTFSYTVAAGQNTSDLTIATVNLNAATVKDSTGNAANLSLTGVTQSGPQIDTTTPTISSLVESPSSGTVNAGSTVTLTMKLTEAVTVAGGTPTLTLNDGGTATYTGGSGTNALAFSYTAAAGQNTSSLAATTVNLNSATVADSAGNTASLLLTGLTQSGPQINTTAPTGSGSSASTPATPTVTSFSPDNGTASDGYTNANSLTLTGTASANTKVEVFDGSAELGATTVNGTGAWSYTTPTLSDGTQSFTAKDVGSAGNASAASAALTVTVVSAATLTQAGNTFDVSTPASDPVLKYDGADVTAGEFGTWVPIAAVKTASGYDVAWTETNADVYTVWTTDINGNYTGNLIGAVAGNSTTWASLAPIFGAASSLSRTVIQTDSSTSLIEIGNQFYLDSSGGSDPALKYENANFTAGQFGGWTPIGAVQTASGYDVAWKNTTSGQYTVWTTDSNGNYSGNLIGAVSGTSTALEALEPIFDQNLNGDGKLTSTVTQTDGSTKLTKVADQVSSAYYLNSTNGLGPALKYQSADVTGGEFGAWTPIGAVQTASGYDVAWKNTANGQYTVWTTDSNGDYTGNLIGTVSGTSTTLESLEPVFGQDINGDGAIGLYAAPNATLQINNSLAGSSGSTTIGAGATLNLAAADSASVTFQGTTGTLRLDQPSTFTGEIFGFRGNGSLSGSDQIDLINIKYNSVHDSYANGVLTVTDGSGDTDKLSFNGSYTLANFKFASDGTGGTIVYDPPVPPSSSQSASAATSDNTSLSTTIGTGATFELATGDHDAITFAGSRGTLILDGSRSGTGALNITDTVSGFGAKDIIDLPGIAFDAQTTLDYLPNGNQTGGRLTVVDGIHNVSIALLGSYMASSFAMTSDNHGGAMLVAETAHPDDQSLLSNPHHA